MRIIKARPMLNHILTTADEYESDVIKDGIIDTSKEEGIVKDIQRIVAVGPNCFEGLNVGDMVLINPMNYSRPEHSLREDSILEKSKDEVKMVVSWPKIEIGGKQCLFLYDRDIDLIIDKVSYDDEK